MGIGLHLEAELLGTCGAAPVLAVSEEELLQGSVAVLLLGKVDILTLGVGEERDVGESQTTIVGGILAQS